MTRFSTKLFMLLVALSSLQLMAQKTPPEFSASIAGGISTLCFQPAATGKSSIGFSSDIGGGFTGLFSPNAGIHVGVNIGLFNVKTKVSAINSVSYGMFFKDVAPEYQSYDLYTQLRDYSEIYKSWYVNIPVMFQFQTRQKQYWNWRQTRKPGFYAMAGIKVAFLFDNKYETQVREIYNKAYLTELNNWADTQLFKGLGVHNNQQRGWSTNGDLVFGVMTMFAFETGVKWRIDKTIYLYTGAYLDVALNDPNKNSRVLYRNEIDVPNTDLSNLSLLQVSNRATSLVVGVKLRFAFIKSQGPF